MSNAVNADSPVAVVGAGTMGAGIAHAFLTAGNTVEVREVSAAAAAAGRERIVRMVRQSFDRGRLEEPMDEVLGRLSVTEGLDRLGHAGLIIEAVPEIPSLKHETWRTISDSAHGDAILASNTSSIAISSIARNAALPGRLLGMHFFNPVPSSQLVEVVRCENTEDHAVDAALLFVRSLGKEPIVVRDSPGFASSRLGVAVGLEAVRMLEEGVASAEDIDRAMVLGYRFPVGPLRLTDLVGLDVRLGIADYLAAELGERFTAPALMRTMVDQGHLGRKSGRGFFDWTS
ncbi:3-hydroxyacyl-CoA dehydrogenase family protein [Arthrobacter sp. NPDC080031]|uniref:3-hydroxyacyl-CoA dehydrogenase family protein n=1 Tax=Arthrobacter sp. NPDC080031 TaxID=3155918 RepID=UPI00344DAF7F